MAENVVEQSCATCSDAIFCKTWGQYKCKQREMWVMDVSLGSSCGFYEKGTPSCDCHCETCDGRIKDDDD